MTGVLLAALGLAACSDRVTDEGVVGATRTTTSSSSAEAESGGVTPPGSIEASNEPETPSSSTADTAESPADEVWPELALSLAPIVTLAQPTVLTTRPGSNDLWLAEREGRVRLVERTLDLEAATEQLRLRTAPALDITGRVSVEGEGGLLGMVFSADGRQLYVHYTDQNGDNVISEFPIGPEFADSEAERVLLRVEEPFSNHNGGDLTFGPDGLLYIGLGDGGSGGDPEGNGQNRGTLLGSILRIDPDPVAGSPYSIPATNPFAVSTEDYRPEIWIWGARNPWRFSFDRDNGDLWIADVGQNKFEEINYLPNGSDGPGRGANLGWNLVEGGSCFQGDCDLANFAAPVAVYDHDLGCSVTGGVVVRRSGLSYLDGAYVYGDFCSGRVWTIDADLPAEPIEILTSPRPISSFAEARDGTVYALTFGGAILRFAAAE